MPLTTFSANSTARASEVNSNFALCVLTDTARTITATHTWSGAQTFDGGFTSGSTATISGAALVVSGTLTATRAVNVSTTVTAASAAARGIDCQPTLISAANSDALAAMYVNSLITNPSAHTGLSGFGVYISNAAGTGTVDTFYGLFIAAPTRGTTNYAIRVAGGLTSLADVEVLGILKADASSAFPGALSATGYRIYANSSTGATFCGFGTSQDTTLANRSGTAVLTIGPNNTAAAFAGTLSVASLLTATSGVVIDGGTSAAGRITKQASTGLQVRGVTGSTHDMELAGPTGSTIMAVPVGTVNADFFGNIAIRAAASSQAAGVLSIGNTTQATVGAAGGASALPATPTGYIKTFIGSTQYVIPYYAQA